MSEFSELSQMALDEWLRVRAGDELHRILAGVMPEIVEGMAERPDDLADAALYLGSLLSAADHLCCTGQEASMQRVADVAAVRRTVAVPAEVAVHSLISLQFLPLDTVRAA